MKHSLVLATLLASGLTLNAAAQTKPAAVLAGPSKIAVISFQKAVAMTNEGQRNFADLQKKYQPKENVLKSLSDEIDGLTKQLQTQSATLSDDARAAQARTIDEKKKKLDRDAEDLRTEGTQEANDMYGTLASKVYDVLASYAQQQGFTLVLDISQQQTPVLIAVPESDITDAVVSAYNVKSGVPAPAAAPKAPAAH